MAQRGWVCHQRPGWARRLCPQSFWPGGPPPWVALLAAGLGVAGTVVAKLLELLSGTVMASKGAALTAKSAALKVVTK